MIRIAKIKKTIPSVIKDVEQLFLEMQNGIMTIRNGLEVSYKVKQALPHDPANLLFGYLTRMKWKLMFVCKCL